MNVPQVESMPQEICYFTACIPAAALFKKLTSHSVLQVVHPLPFYNLAVGVCFKLGLHQAL